MADTTTTAAPVAPAPAAAVSPSAVSATPETEAPAAGVSADPAAPSEAGTVVVAHWPPLTAAHPLLAFHARLAGIVQSSGHGRLWGVQLNTSSPDFGTFVVLQKYLRSTCGDLELAAANLGKTLVWRREFGLDTEEESTAAGDGERKEYISPRELGDEFAGLGYVTEVTRGQQREVVTWNIYGAVTEMQATFGDVDRFLQWRVALMERALRRLQLHSTTTPIPDFGQGDDPHRLAQVHVYTGVSFLRMDPHVKAASKATIELMGAHYPETLSRKMFVGVPLLMSWVFTAVRVFVSAETARKFVVVSYPNNLAAELSDDGADLPEEYGGTGPALGELEKRAEK